MLIRRKPLVFPFLFRLLQYGVMVTNRFDNKRVSHGDEGIMGVVEGVVDVINIAFPPSYPRSKITSLVIPYSNKSHIVLEILFIPTTIS